MLRCPREVAPFLSDILRVAVAFTKYDPNYAYESDSEGKEKRDCKTTCGLC